MKTEKAGEAAVALWDSFSEFHILQTCASIQNNNSASTDKIWRGSVQKWTDRGIITCDPRRMSTHIIAKRILIADDDASIRKVLRSFIESRTQFTICGEAVTGLDAIQKARSTKPDLIVMDLSMPVLDGLEAGSVLNAMLPTIPIVIYTMHDCNMVEPRAFEVGVRAVVQKHDIVGLAQRLKELLG